LKPLRKDHAARVRAAKARKAFLPNISKLFGARAGLLPTFIEPSLASVLDLMLRHKHRLPAEQNDHKTEHSSAEEWIAEAENLPGGCWFDWVNDEQRQKAIEIVSGSSSGTQTRHWEAADLDVLLDAVRE
jgi:hypothetical protein